MELRNLAGLFLAILTLAPRGYTLNIVNLTTTVGSTNIAADIHNNFVGLAFHGSTVAGNKLYVDGGEISFVGSDGEDGIEQVTLNHTLSLDLSQSWTTSSVQYSFINKAVLVPILNYGTVWPAPDNNSFYTFGGVRTTVPSAPKLTNVQIYQYSSDKWLGLSSSSLSSPTLNNNRPAGAASTHGNGIGYLLGGFKGNTAAPWSPLPGLLTYNMRNNSWTNESTAALAPTTVIGGVLTYVPTFGKEGILISMGGQYSGLDAWMNNAANFVPFSNISVWDIATKTWYWQEATAKINDSDIPDSAMFFCSTSTAGSNGTFEIFVFGGQSDTFSLGSRTPTDSDNAAQAKFGSVYVLSLPGFVWTKVSSDTDPRTGHTCELIGKRQMLSIGGRNPTLGTDGETIPDNFTQGLGIFDMVDLKWKNSYDASAAAYVTPSIISSWYNGRNLSTSIHWSSSAMQELFINTTTTTSANAGESKPTTTVTNVVIPATVGAVVGAVVLTGIMFWLWRCYRKQKEERAESAPRTSTDSFDPLTNNIRRHLEAARDSYLTQRGAFIHHSKESTPQEIFFHPSSLGTIRSIPPPPSTINSRRHRPSLQNGTQSIGSPVTRSSSHYSQGSIHIIPPATAAATPVIGELRGSETTDRTMVTDSPHSTTSLLRAPPTSLATPDTPEALELPTQPSTPANAHYSPRPWSPLNVTPERNRNSSPSTPASKSSRRSNFTEDIDQTPRTTPGIPLQVRRPSRPLPPVPGENHDDRRGNGGGVHEMA